MEKHMSYLKTLVSDICNDFEMGGLDYQELSQKYEMTISEIQEVVDFYYYQVQ